jgi:choline-glycine betaine transporter
MIHFIAIYGGLSLIFVMMIAVMIGLFRELRNDLRADTEAKTALKVTDSPESESVLDESAQDTRANLHAARSEVGTTKQGSTPRMDVPRDPDLMSR